MRVPNGLAFSEFRGYESWETIKSGPRMAVILGNPVRIDAYKAGITFTPGTSTDKPPQADDAKCGVACHMIAKERDHVFTEYGKR